MHTFGFYNDTAPPIQLDDSLFGLILEGGVAPATLVQYKLENNFIGNSISFNSPLTQGNLGICVIMGSGGTTTPTLTDNLGNAWTLFEEVTIVGSTSRIFAFYCYNCLGGSATLTLGSLDLTTNKVAFVCEYSGVLSTSNPLLTSAHNSGGSILLTNNLTYSYDSLIFSAWFNPSDNAKIGIYQDELTYISNDVAGPTKFNAQMQSLKKPKYLSPITIGIQTDTSVASVIVTGVFRLGK